MVNYLITTILLLMICKLEWQDRVVLLGLAIYLSIVITLPVNVYGYLVLNVSLCTTMSYCLSVSHRGVLSWIKNYLPVVIIKLVEIFTIIYPLYVSGILVQYLFNLDTWFIQGVILTIVFHDKEFKLVEEFCARKVLIGMVVLVGMV